MISLPVPRIRHVALHPRSMPVQPSTASPEKSEPESVRNPSLPPWERKAIARCVPCWTREHDESSGQETLVRDYFSEDFRCEGPQRPSCSIQRVTYDGMFSIATFLD